MAASNTQPTSNPQPAPNPQPASNTQPASNRGRNWAKAAAVGTGKFAYKMGRSYAKDKYIDPFLDFAVPDEYDLSKISNNTGLPFAPTARPWLPKDVSNYLDYVTDRYATVKNTDPLLKQTAAVALTQVPVVASLADFNDASLGQTAQDVLDFTKLGIGTDVVGTSIQSYSNLFGNGKLHDYINLFGHAIRRPGQTIDVLSDMASRALIGQDSIDKFNNTVALETPIDDEYLATREYIRQRHAQKAIEKAKADAIAKEIVNKDISAFNDISKSAQIKTQTVDTKEPIQEQTQETTDTSVKSQGDDNMSFTWPSNMNVGAVVSRASQLKPASNDTRPTFNDTRPGDQPYLYGSPDDYAARRAAIDANSSNGTAAVTQGTQGTQVTQGTDSKFVPDGHTKNVVSNNESPVAHPSNDFSNQFMQYMMYKDFMKDQNRQATKQDMGIIPLLLAAYGIGRIIR